jgi:D-alanyl-D-alanine carboxypeptidase
LFSPVKTDVRMRSRPLGLALAVTLLALPTTAQAGPVVVADLASGQVLEAEDATRPWYPASITKLMTVYVTLKQIRLGKLNMNSPLPVTAHAAAMPPSKIGVKPGQTVTVENALKILMVKSANDIAVVVAEGVGGSVDTFAAMMNSEARAIGMQESHFVNPNGLFAETQQTSARDMAILARRIMLEFPQHRSLFSIGAIRLGDRVMENTNGVIGRYPGATGMKTGFICSSGFNVVTTAARDGRELVAVVLGSQTATERTLKAMNLLDSGFHRPLAGPPLESLPPSTETSVPDMREAICGRRMQNEASTPTAEGEAGAATTVATNQTLGPRDIFDPIPVFIGKAPAIAPTAKAKKLAEPPIKTASDGRKSVALPTKPGEPTSATPQPLLPQGALLGPPIRPTGLEKGR